MIIKLRDKPFHKDVCPSCGERFTEEEMNNVYIFHLQYGQLSKEVIRFFASNPIYGSDNHGIIIRICRRCDNIIPNIEVDNNINKRFKL